MKRLDSEMLMDSPVIAAIKDEEGLRECLDTDCRLFSFCLAIYAILEILSTG